MNLLLTTLLLAATAGPLPVVDLAELPRLSPGEARGEVLIVTGRVLDTDGNPVAGAEVYAYHADGEGNYHDDAYRGTVRTDRDGTYRFWTIRPGGYGPPPHIHFRVSAGARPELRPTLHFNRNGVPHREVQFDGGTAVEYTYDIAWGRR